MAFKIGDRILETSTSTGTGAFTLAGAVTGFRRFSAVLSNSDITSYLIDGGATGEWEIGIGTWSSNVLTRTTVIYSSNSNNAVSFSSGTKRVAIVPLARQIVSSTVLSGSAVALTTSVDANVTSISLTPGDWDIYGTVSFTTSASTSVTIWLQSISPTSATALLTPGNASVTRFPAFVPGATTTAAVLPTLVTRVSITTTTTFYLVASSVFTVSQMFAYGKLWAVQAL